MRDRRRMQEHVAAANLGHQIGQKCADFSEFAPRREDDGLRLAGRAAGVTEAQGIFESAIDDACAAATLLEHAREFITADEDFRVHPLNVVVNHRATAAVRNLVDVIGERLAHIELHADQTRLGERVVDDQALDRVRQQDADAVTRSHAAVQQSVSDAVRGRIEIRKAQRPPPLSKAGSRSKLQRCAPNHRPNLHDVAPPSTVRGCAVPKDRLRQHPQGNLYRCLTSKSIPGWTRVVSPDRLISQGRWLGSSCRSPEDVPFSSQAAPAVLAPRRSCGLNSSRGPYPRAERRPSLPRGLQACAPPPP